MYSRAISKVGLLTEEEQKSIEEGLKKIYKEWSDGKFEILPSDEDIHTANERRLKVALLFFKMKSTNIFKIN